MKISTKSKTFLAGIVATILFNTTGMPSPVIAEEFSTAGVQTCSSSLALFLHLPDTHDTYELLKDAARCAKPGDLKAFVQSTVKVHDWTERRRLAGFTARVLQERPDLATGVADETLDLLARNSGADFAAAPFKEVLKHDPHAFSPDAVERFMEAVTNTPDFRDAEQMIAYITPLAKATPSPAVAKAMANGTLTAIQKHSSMGAFGTCLRTLLSNAPEAFSETTFKGFIQNIVEQIDGTKPAKMGDGTGTIDLAEVGALVMKDRPDLQRAVAEQVKALQQAHGDRRAVITLTKAILPAMVRPATGGNNGANHDGQKRIMHLNMS